MAESTIGIDYLYPLTTSCERKSSTEPIQPDRPGTRAASKPWTSSTDLTGGRECPATSPHMSRPVTCVFGLKPQDLHPKASFNRYQSRSEPGQIFPSTTSLRCRPAKGTAANISISLLSSAD